ncbi:hypothetical protein LJC58_07320 [Lachnospiraceae bacterium OttesenSCG-928-D06]|nr:hypothetical protein [Lachnospiraceae bacterium OttesenSCG-928-D06]
MLKMVISLNDNKINTEGKYKSASIYNAIDNAFLQMGLRRISDETNRLQYCDNGDARDYGRFGKIVNTLKRQPWFLDNISEWLLYTSEDSETPEDYNVEDLLRHYQGKKMLRA